VRVLVTGADGFVGTWLTRELVGTGHEVVALEPGIDIRDTEAVTIAVVGARPDAIAHLAAVSFGPEASADPGQAFAVAVGGTVNVLEAARALPQPPVVLVTGSSEAYGTPLPEDLPLKEGHALLGRSPYALSKIAQESVAVAYAGRYGMPVIATRSFNHVGPGQRTDFVVPALAGRVAALRARQADHIPVGNLDVRRDLTDVRDVTRAYRLLLETAADRPGSNGLVVNVCSGQSVSIRWVAEELCRLAGVEPRLEVDPELVRPGEAPDLRGDYSVLEGLAGWRPAIALADTLRDIWRGVQS
jgi:GDP-4-dehydro-6-deoxy-D-mannose reductase